MSASELRALNARNFGRGEARHLLTRAGFGGSAAEIAELEELGLKKAVRRLVRFEAVDSIPVDVSAFDDSIMAPQSEEQRRAYARARRQQDEAALERFRRMRQERQRRDRRQIRDMQRWWLERMINTARPLEEKMTLFYHGHFATSYRGIENSWHLLLQNQRFRKHATGNFGELCLQIVRDPAMLAYLNNNRSRRQAPNENLARELMELFTLGEGNGYSERDIKEGARALTGYTFDHNSFVFRREWHDGGVKRILGKRGRFDGDEFVQIILGRNECSQFLCLKLYEFFVRDLPEGPDEDAKRVILALAEEMRRQKYDLADVLETLFMSAHFYETRNIASQIKSPVQLLVEAIRSLELPAPDLNLLVSALDLMGQNLFFPPSVEGWDGGRAWINTSTLFVRQNLLVNLLTGRRPSGRGRGRRAVAGNYDATSLISDRTGKTVAPADPSTAIDALSRLCLGRELIDERRRVLLDYADKHGGEMTNELLIGLLCLITAMPEYQLC